MLCLGTGEGHSETNGLESGGALRAAGPRDWLNRVGSNTYVRLGGSPRDREQPRPPNSLGRPAMRTSAEQQEQHHDTTITTRKRAGVVRGNQYVRNLLVTRVGAEQQRTATPVAQTTAGDNSVVTTGY